MATIKNTINDAYCRLERATESSHEASKLLRTAYEAAVQGEKAHRRLGASFGGTYKASVATAAQYFVCKWFNSSSAHPTNAREACSMRADCLNAMALRELLDAEHVSVEMPGIDDLNYTTDIVGAS